MFKKLIAPVQAVLLKKGVCPGCGRQLTQAKKRERVSDNHERVICACKRVFIFDKKLQEYRRALVSEL